MDTKTAQEIAQKHKSTKVVIIASRRTDMPAFFTSELIDGLRKGVFQPQGKMQNVWEFKFEPSDIHSVGLWSQDFSKWIERRNELQDLIRYSEYGEFSHHCGHGCVQCYARG